MAIITLNNNSLSSVTSLPAAISTGKVLQVANDLDTANIVLSTSSWVDTNLSISFTPVSASSKLLMLATIQGYSNGNSSSYYGEFQAKFVHDGSDAGEAYNRLTPNQSNAVVSIHEAYSYQIDSGSTSARTIKVQVRNPQTNQGYCTYNQYGGYSSLSVWEYET